MNFRAAAATWPPCLFLEDEHGLAHNKAACMAGGQMQDVDGMRR